MQAIESVTHATRLRDLVATLRSMERDGIRLSAHRQDGTPSDSDFLRVVPLGDKRYLVAAGHVVGLDAEASRLAEELGEHVESRSRLALDLADLAATANEHLHELTGGERLASLLLLVLDGRTGSFRIANAGHPEPMAVGRSGGVVSLQGHGPAIGLLPEVEYRSSGPLRLARGMIVLAATEGVFESRDRDGTTFGRERISRVLARHREDGVRAAVRSVLDAADRHAGGRRDADRAVLAFQFVDPPSEAASLTAA